MSVIVWSKNNCPFCDMAKNLLKLKGMVYEERNISGDQWTKEDLLKMVPDARTVPQIVIDGNNIGGYDKLKERLG